MSAVKHTRGPWSYDRGVIPPDGPGRYSTVSTEGGDLVIAEVNDLIPEGLANASLIIAAPDLLAAAEDALGDAEIATSERNGWSYSFCTSCGANDLSEPVVIEHRKNCAWLKVRAAIAKAGSPS